MGREATIAPTFRLADAAYAAGLVAKREGERRLGEGIDIPAGASLQESLRASNAVYVLLGIPEDIGVRANGGVGGAHTLWDPALKAILNTQFTPDAEKLLLLGHFDFKDLMQQSESLDSSGLRQLVGEIDAAVFPVLEAIAAAEKIPIVIGGGHNNAYPIIKGISRAKGKAINAINLDAHADYRRREGRHSGNPFRYAADDGYLDKYAMVGLHRAYNNPDILAAFEGATNRQASFYEDIFIAENFSFDTAVASAISFTADNATGIELDLDCIEGVLASAATPCGITTIHARRYLQHCLQNTATAYIHLTEGAVQLRGGRADHGTAKLMAYLVTDILRAGAAGAK